MGVEEAFLEAMGVVQPSLLEAAAASWTKMGKPKVITTVTPLVALFLTNPYWIIHISCRDRTRSRSPLSRGPGSSEGWSVDDWAELETLKGQRELCQGAIDRAEVNKSKLYNFIALKYIVHF